MRLISRRLVGTLFANHFPLSGTPTGKGTFSVEVTGVGYHRHTFAVAVLAFAEPNPITPVFAIQH